MKVDVAPLRNAFERSDLPPSLVCRRLGWVEPRGKCETSRLRRALGIVPKQNSRNHPRAPGQKTTAQRIGYDRAMKIACALDLDPVDVGL